MDRTRGGRSSYGGSSPLDTPKRKRPVKIVPMRSPVSSGDAPSVATPVIAAKRPFVPQELVDIMNLESILNEDDVPPNFNVDDFSLSNPNVFVTLLQLCELKLYKIVRWARNLPYFANVSVSSWISCS